MIASPHPTPSARGFTLVELVVSTAIIALLLLLLVSITSQTSTTWRYTAGKIEQFRAARAAFETMTTRLSQATLNTYLDYLDKNGLPRDSKTVVDFNKPSFVPVKYARQSELLFISGQASKLLGADSTRLTHGVFFHAPLGMTEDQDTNTNADPALSSLNNLLNVWGYYLEYSDDKPLRPDFFNGMTNPPPLRFRFRLMEFMQPSQKLSTYDPTWSGVNGRPNVGSDAQFAWFKPAINGATPPVHVLSENIIALIIRPQLSKQDREQRSKAGKKTELTTDYTYDTRYDPSAAKNKYPDAGLNPVNQLPPILQITMVAIDEPSAIRLNLKEGMQDVFKVATKFTNPASYDTDLLRQGGGDGSLEDELIKQRVSYRIFSTNVLIRGAKWSRGQTN